MPAGFRESTLARKSRSSFRSAPLGDMAQVDEFRSAPGLLAGSVSRDARAARKALPAAHGANVPQHRASQNWQRFVAGGISGVAEVLVSHPLDLGEPWLAPP